MDNKTLEHKIKEVKEVKRFGESELGLNFGKAFSRLDISKTQHFYWVYASPKNKLHPMRSSDGASYNKFRHNKKDAEIFLKKLEKEGYDVLLFEAEAAGFKECQITKGLLKLPHAELTWIVLHEGFHIHSDINGIKIPYKLEEAICNYIGFNGAIEFFKKYNPSLLPEALAEKNDYASFFKLCLKYYTELSECYEKGGKKREEILSSARKEFNALKKSCKSRAIKDRCSLPINNAFFVRYRDYTEVNEPVEKFLKKYSIPHYLMNINKINSSLKKEIL